VLGGFCWLEVLEVPEVMRCVTLEACGLSFLEALEVPKLIRRMLLCMLEVMDGELGLLEVLDVVKVVDV